MTREQRRSLKLVVADRVGKQTAELIKGTKDRLEKLNKDRSAYIRSYFQLGVKAGNVRLAKKDVYGDVKLVDGGKAVRHDVDVPLGVVQRKALKDFDKLHDQLNVDFPDVDKILALVLAEADLMEVEDVMKQLDKFVEKVLKRFRDGATPSRYSNSW